MKLLPLNFPVFYHCVVKQNTNLKQYDAVSVLLLGKLREQCKPHIDIEILDSVAANYVSGKKRIRKEILNPLLVCSVKEAERRLRMLGIQSMEGLVPVLERLFAISMALNKKDLDTLLGEYESTSDAYRFVANVFLVSVKCPARYTSVLSKEDKELIRSCYSEKPIHQDLIERSGGQLISVHRDDIWNTAPAISFRYRQVILPDDYQMVMDYLLPLISEENALMRLDKAHLESFFSEAKDNTYIGFFECFGPYTYILQQIQQAKLFSDSTAQLFLQVIPPDMELARVDLIYESTADGKKQIESSFTGIIVDENIASDYEKVIIIFQREMTKSERQEKGTKGKKINKQGAKMDLFDFIRIYGGN